MLDFAALSAPTPDLAALAQTFVDPEQDRATKRGYLQWFAGGANLLDLGCGHGAFLDVARQAGLPARGVDASATAVAACTARGLAAEFADIGESLRTAQQRGETFAGVLLAHVVEHLPPATVATLFVAIAAVLAPGGRLVVVTPNVRNLIVLEETFWLDPTHLRPYPRLLLQKLGEAAGLSLVASYDDPASCPRRTGLRRLLTWLRTRISGADRSGPMDAVVVLTRR